MSSDKINLLNLGIAELSAFFESIDEPKFRTVQLIKWIHKHGVIDYTAMNDLSKKLREKLLENTCIELPTVVQRALAHDGTFKLLMRMHDGNSIETVFIPEKERGTLCVSSQVGCALNCSFCSTGKQGFNRDLQLSEIIGQVWLAKHELEKLNPENPRRITNVVMMGMGEPLLNYKPVVNAMELMLNDNTYNLSKYRVTLSTSGVIPKMLQLKNDSPVSLAVSLHAPNNTLRNELVPLNKKYPLEELIPVCENYFPKKSQQQVMYEYVMLEDVNDSIHQAKELVKLLSTHACKINLIPFNPFPKTNYKTSQLEVIEKFSQVLIKAGFNTRIRRTRGEKIDAACGQLAGQFDDRTGRHERWLKTGKLVPNREHK